MCECQERHRGLIAAVFAKLNDLFYTVCMAAAQKGTVSQLPILPPELATNYG